MSSRRLHLFSGSAILGLSIGLMTAKYGLWSLFPGSLYYLWWYLIFFRGEQIKDIPSPTR